MQCVRMMCTAVRVFQPARRWFVPGSPNRKAKRPLFDSQLMKAAVSCSRIFHFEQARAGLRLACSRKTNHKKVSNFNPGRLDPNANMWCCQAVKLSSASL